MIIMAVDSEVKPLRITIGSDDAGVSYKKAISADLICWRKITWQGVLYLSINQ